MPLRKGLTTSIPGDAREAAVRIEVVYATKSRQELVELSVEVPPTVAEAIRLSGIGARVPDTDLDALDVGIWGRVVSRDTIVSDGDRIEIYRPLQRDPREARRLRAAQTDSHG